ncbi:MAG: 3-dehydroquinate synthase [Acidobacteriaceae bacterium]|nr:3-dehydroquinate synthase [Acidobacteriaceae bacterium]MBV8569956.1 3-dehydroquinate synthase [Acidobacteriaceae bacterium]
MPVFEVKTAQRNYSAVVERGILRRVREYIPERAGKLFIVTTRDVWELHGTALEQHLSGAEYKTLFFPGGEANKRLSEMENLADGMLAGGADRSSVVIGFGGGIVTDLAGFAAATFMRGVRVLQIPTTLLAQVDAAVGGKTGVNLAQGKNLIGSFHQPLAVLIDPELLATLPPREYRAGLFEVIKCGIIRDRALFNLLDSCSETLLSFDPGLVLDSIAAAVRIKAEVVSADEREGDLRRILNFGHTVGHAIEAETAYVRFLHGEAVAWGMLAATKLAELLHLLPDADAFAIRRCICRYGPLPPAADLDPARLVARLGSDKKTVQGSVHFVLPTAIGCVRIISGVERELIHQAISLALRP